MQKSQKQKYLEAFFIMAPGLLYVILFTSLWIIVGNRTSKPGYTEDYSGLSVIAIPFIAFIHYAAGTLVAAIIFGLTRLFKAKINFLPILAGVLFAPVVVFLFMWVFSSLFGY